MSLYKYGYVPDHADQRDLKFSLATPDDLSHIKPEVDLSNYILNIKDQGQLGSCTGNAETSAVEFERAKKGLSNILLSRLQLYYDERNLEGTILEDAGANIRDGIKSLTKLGVAKEELWPYDITKFADKPTPNVYQDAKNNTVNIYRRVSINARSVKAALSAGYAVIAGISVYESFEGEDVSKTGIVPMPKASEQLLGGHCVLIVGYKNGKFKVLNSWGSAWGDKGYFYLDEAYVGNSDLTSDLWIIESIHSTD